MTETQLLPAELPDGQALVEEGRRLADTFAVGRYLLCREHGVGSEPDYKRKMLEQDRIMLDISIGLSSWRDTAEALSRIYEECERRGVRVDRFKLIPDRRMGLPRHLWGQSPRETGPMLVDDEDWAEIGQVVPIAPHIGDYMIGSPMSVENARRALEAGVSYIGNLSQFHWKYPSFDDEVAQGVETVKALGLMAAKAPDGAMVHTYLDDGHAAQFADYCSYVGLALLERHIVGLAGARLSVAYGGLTTNPITRSAVMLALEEITPAETLNAYYHGNTTDYTSQLDRNYAVMVTDCLFSMVTNLRARSGAAIHVVPVMEAVRIPSWHEVVEAQTIAERVKEDAYRLVDLIDWAPIDAMKDRLVAGGRQFFDNAVVGLRQLGVETDDALQLLLATRALGGTELERRFGVGSMGRNREGTPEPLFPTDTFSALNERRRAVSAAVAGVRVAEPLLVRPVVGCTDVHEYGLELVLEALRATGVEPVVAGLAVDPDVLADRAAEVGATAVVVSTHNGMALDYARRLVAELRDRGLDVPICMGGTLNQNVEGSDIPVDVREELQALGIRVCGAAEEIVSALGLSS